MNGSACVRVLLLFLIDLVYKNDKFLWFYPNL